jgi:uncharacterized repeat protein (TIGR03803 family)
LHVFTGGNDGLAPTAALVQGSDGNFYGTTEYNANPIVPVGCGTVFKITPNGALTTLYAFGTVTDAKGVPLDGAGPSALVQGSDGKFYGTTSGGGTYGAGTVF